MNNPIFKDYKTRIFYSSIWMLIVSIQILAFYLFSEQSLLYILVDSLTYNLLFAVLAIQLWYPIYFNLRSNAPWYHVIAMNVVMAGILIVVWQIISYLLVTLFTGVDETYHIFLVKTIPWRIIAGIFFYSIIILIYYLAIHISKLREKAENEIRLNRIIKDSELNLLKSQINPHFLFNSLNSVNSLILINPTAAQEMIVGLSEFLRYSVLSNHQEYMNLEQEIENVKRYLSIEKIRFGNKLSFSFDIAPETLDVKLPAMVLQPLFENAIKHGVYESIQAVNIQTKTEKKGNHILIEVVNDFDTENIPSRKGSGTGLKNIRERLRLLYGRNAFLHTQKDTERFHAFIQIPAQK